MKKLIIHILVFASCVFLIDFTFGRMMSYLRNKSLYSNKIDYVVDVCDAEVLIMGSSKAAEHYCSSIIADSLRRSVYNCGLPGNGIIGAYVFLTQITKRYKPFCIVYEVTPWYDYYSVDPLIKYINVFKHLYGRDAVNDIFEKCDSDEIVKLKSNLYKYNNRFAINALFSQNNSALNNMGFHPLTGVLDITTIKKKDKKSNLIEFDPTKYNYLKAFAELCVSRNINIVFVVSPRYTQDNTGDYHYAKEICEDLNIPFIDNRNYPSVSDKPSMFHDEIHLNKEGASIYSQIFSSQLKNIISSFDCNN